VFSEIDITHPHDIIKCKFFSSRICVRATLEKGIHPDIQLVSRCLYVGNNYGSNLCVPSAPVVMVQCILGWVEAIFILVGTMNTQSVGFNIKSRTHEVFICLIQSNKGKEIILCLIALMAATAALISVICYFQILIFGHYQGAETLVGTYIGHIETKKFNAVKHDLILAIKKEVCNVK